MSERNKEEREERGVWFEVKEREEKDFKKERNKNRKSRKDVGKRRK